MLDERCCCDEKCPLVGGTAAVFYDALLLSMDFKIYDFAHHACIIRCITVIDVDIYRCTDV
jgi:hypothetical protein